MKISDINEATMLAGVLPDINGSRARILTRRGISAYFNAASLHLPLMIAGAGKHPELMLLAAPFIQRAVELNGGMPTVLQLREAGRQIGGMVRRRLAKS